MAPKTATKQEGAQEVEEYTYPRGVSADGWEVVSRHGVCKDIVRVGGVTEPEFHPSDGNEVLPVVNQPSTIILRMGGTIQAGQGVTLYFKRRHGSTGAYTGYNILLDGPGQTRKPFTIAQ